MADDPHDDSSYIQRALQAMDEEDSNHRDYDALPNGSDTDFIIESNNESILGKLTRHWMDERNAPDILMWQGLVVQEALDKLQSQAQMVEQLQSDPRTSEEEHFRIVLVQTETERVKFLVRSYLRTRLHKIEKYAAYIVSTPSMRGRLSVIELSHAEKYHALLSKHFLDSALNGAPEAVRSLTEEGDTVGPSMVTKPNTSQAVFIRARRSCGPVTLRDGSLLNFEKGGIHLLSYAIIEGLLKAGDVELV